MAGLETVSAVAAAVDDIRMGKREEEESAETTRMLLATALRLAGRAVRERAYLTACDNILLLFFFFDQVDLMVV